MFFAKKEETARKTGLILLVALLCLSLVWPSSMLGAPATTDSPELVAEVKEIIREYYPLPIPAEVDKATSVQGVLNALGDPYATYMSAEEYMDFIGAINMTFVGIGVILETHPNGVLIKQVYESSPAEKAGVQPGDVITKVDDKVLKGLTLEEASNALSGEVGSRVSLTWTRETQEFTTTITRTEIHVPLVVGEVLEGIGYITIYSFGDGAGRQFGTIVKKLREEGAKSWIIDLTYNGGGVIYEALSLLGYFIGGKDAVIWESAQTLAVEKAIPQKDLIREPVVLLTNEYSASASEIVTGALKDYRMVAVLGGQTYGSGRFKNVFPLSNGDFLYMTITRFYTPFSTTVDYVGINPHVSLSDQDALLLGYLLLKSGALPLAPATGTAATIGKPAAAGSMTGAPAVEVKDETGYLKVKIGGQAFRVALSDWCQDTYWSVGQKLLDAAFWTTMFELGTENGWRAMNEEYLQQRWQIYYPGYAILAQQNIARQGTAIVKTATAGGFQGQWSQAELIDALSGQRIKCGVEAVSGGFIMTPVEPLAAKHEYWLVIPSADSRSGGVAVVHTGA